MLKKVLIFTFATFLALKSKELKIYAADGCSDELITLADSSLDQFFQTLGKELQRREPWTQKKIFEALAISPFPYSVNYIPHPAIFNKILNFLGLSDDGRKPLSVEDAYKDLSDAISGKVPSDISENLSAKQMKELKNLISGNLNLVKTPSSSRETRDFINFIRAEAQLIAILKGKERSLEKKVMIAIYFLLHKKRPRPSEHLLNALNEILLDRNLWSKYSAEWPSNNDFLKIKMQGD